MMSYLPVKGWPRTALWGILLTFAALSLACSLAIPLKYGPDEPAHFIYIRSMATNFAPPSIAHYETHSEQSAASHEGHQPPLYYALLAIPYAVLNAFGLSTPVIWRILRIVGIPIGVIWICLVYGLCREFFERDDYALAVTGFTALIPTSVYMTGVLSNDILITLLFTWALIPIVHYFRSGCIDIRSALVLGVAAGLAILTKAQGLVLLPVFVLTAVLVWRRRNYKRIGEMLLPIVVMVGAAALVSGWWFIRCKMLYGTMMPQSLSNPALERGLKELLDNPSLSVVAIHSITSMLYGFFWTPYWLLRAYLPWNHYISLLGSITGLIALGFLLRLKRKTEQYMSQFALLLSAAIMLYIAYIRYVLVVDYMANQQGRLFLPVAVVAGIAAVMGLDGWLKSPRAKKIGVVIIAALMILSNIAIMTCGYVYYANGGA